MKDPDATEYIDAIGGLPSLRAQAVHDLVISLKRIGWWHNWIGLYPLLNGKGTNLRRPSDYALTAVGAGALFTDLGLTTNGTDSAFSTGISPGNLNMQATGQVESGMHGTFAICSYLRVAAADNAAARDGCATGTARLEIAPRDGANTRVWYGTTSATAPAYAAGWRSAIRQIGAVPERMIRIGWTDTNALASTAGNTMPTDVYHIGASSQNGVLGGFWPASYSFYGVGYGDSGGAIQGVGPGALLRDIVGRFLTQMGRHLLFA